MKIFVLGALSLTIALAADPKADLVKHITAAKEFSLDVAKAMPAEGYSFKAEDKVQPPDRTFGEVMIHIGQSTFNYCGAVSGVKAPAPPVTATDKTAIVQFISDAFDGCLKAAEGETNLGRSIKRGNTEMTAQELIWGGLMHDAHHRGQAEVYLRLRGVKPPAYRF